MDYGHEQTDKMLTQLEKRLKTEYSKASRGISRSMREYLKDFEREDSEMLKLLNENKITEKKYLAWRNTQMATGTRWEHMKSTIAEDLQNVSNIAADMIRDHSYDAYALNHNYGTFEIEQGAKADTSYTLYDRATVERLVAQNPKLLHAPGKRTQKLIEEGKAKLWNNRQVQSVMTQAVLQGMPVPKIANYLAKTVGERNLHVATRSARTLITGAENAGRVDSYERARGMGINVKARWMATLDSRTRHSHRQLDGEVADDDGLFSNGLRFPGDPDGPFSEICNCRCTLVGWIKGINDDLFDPSNRITGKGFTDYEDWKQAHEKGLHPNGIVDGKDISATWERRKGKYDFEIEDVINAQGFDGKPRVVDADEFDKLVSESNFIAQRTYKATTQEILEDYRDQLYNGKWYVDCSTGGHMFGRGMYCEGLLGTEVSDKMRNTMLGYGASSEHSFIETFTLAKSARVVNYNDIPKLRQGIVEERLNKLMANKGYAPEEKKFIYLQNAVTPFAGDELINTVHWASDNPDRVREIMQDFMMPNNQKIADIRNEVIGMDEGSVAVLKGYDAINCEDITEKGDEGYFVILNRTKVIFKKG